MCRGEGRGAHISGGGGQRASNQPPTARRHKAPCGGSTRRGPTLRREEACAGRAEGNGRVPPIHDGSKLSPSRSQGAVRCARMEGTGGGRNGLQTGYKYHRSGCCVCECGKGGGELQDGLHGTRYCKRTRCDLRDSVCSGPAEGKAVSTAQGHGAARLDGAGPRDVLDIGPGN